MAMAAVIFMLLELIARDSLELREIESLQDFPLKVFNQFVFAGAQFQRFADHLDTGSGSSEDPPGSLSFVGYNG